MGFCASSFLNTFLDRISSNASISSPPQARYTGIYCLICFIILLPNVILNLSIMYASSFLSLLAFLAVMPYSFCALATMASNCCAEIRTCGEGTASKNCVFLSRLMTMARSYTLSEMAKVESSLFAVPTNHILGGSLSLPPLSSAGSPFCTSETTSIYLFSGSGSSKSDKNSAK